MKAILLLLPVAGLLLAGCGNDTSKSSTSGGNPITASADYIGAVGQAQKSALKTTGKASLDQAINMFQAEKNRLPNNLDELVSSGILPKLPAAPNGMRFDYDPATGTVKAVAK